MEACAEFNCISRCWIVSFWSCIWLDIWDAFRAPFCFDCSEHGIIHGLLWHNDSLHWINHPWICSSHLLLHYDLILSSISILVDELLDLMYNQEVKVIQRRSTSKSKVSITKEVWNNVNEEEKGKETWKYYCPQRLSVEYALQRRPKRPN